MKIQKLLYSAFVALILGGLAACSNDETEGTGVDNGYNAEVVKNVNAKVVPTTRGNNTAEFVVPSGTKSVIVDYPTASGVESMTIGINPVDIYDANGKATGFAKASVRFNSPVDTKISIRMDEATAAKAKAMRKADKHWADDYVLQNMTLSAGDGTVVVSSTDKHATPDPDFFLGYFPESKNHENYKGVLPNFAQNFLYKSDGNGFDIYPEYSLGTYVWRLGIFYYDSEGEKHDVQIWDTADNWKHTDKAQELIIPGTTTAIHVEIPKDVVFGFYVYSYSYRDADGFGHEYRSYDATTGEYYKATHYSYKELNTICPVKTLDSTGKYFDWADEWRTYSGAEHPAKECHAITFSNEENTRTYIGFEDSDHDVWAWGGEGNCYGSDRDFNDLIFWISPVQKVIPGPNDKGEGEDKIKKELEEPSVEPEDPGVDPGEDPVELPDDVVKPTTETKDGDYYNHSSGVCFFDTDKDKDYNDAVLDYDIEGYLPGTTSTEAGKYPYIKATIHVRAIAETIKEAGLDFENLQKEWICEADDMYITVKGETFESTVISGENIATGSAHTVALKGLEWITSASAVAAGFNKNTEGTGLYYNVENIDMNSGDGLLTITVVMYPKNYDPANIDLWKSRLDAIVTDIANQKFFVTTKEDKLIYDCVKAPVNTKHPAITETGTAYTLTEAYPKFANWVATNGAKDADWYLYGDGDKLANWW